jgi:hypothetical protein
MKLGAAQMGTMTMSCCYYDDYAIADYAAAPETIDS